MKKKLRHLKPVLKWWIIFCLLIFGIGYAQMTVDLFSMMNQADITKLSFLISAVFISYMVVLGVRLSKFCRNINNLFNISNFVRIIKHGWFLSNIFASLGLLGTLFGMINMFYISGLGGDKVDVSSLGNAVAGLQTAIYTTVAALIATIIIQCTLYIIENDIEIIEERNDCKIIGVQE